MIPLKLSAECAYMKSTGSKEHRSHLTLLSIQPSWVQGFTSDFPQSQGQAFPSTPGKKELLPW